jgi:hypothetical protein
MSDSSGREPGTFVVTKGYRRFTELCDVCRRARSIGLRYGPPGTGKPESARYYVQRDQIEPFLPEPLMACIPTDLLLSLPLQLKHPSRSAERCSILPWYLLRQDGSNVK